MISLTQSGKLTQSKKFSILFLLQAFATGMLAPVINLYLLTKKIEINQLAIIMGIYAFTVLALEVPTGVLADLYGRKKTFILSTAFSGLSIVIFYFSMNIYQVGIGIVLYGISRALSSGSLDALFIDWVITKKGKDGLASASARLSILESVGLAVGAAIGGFLPSLGRYLPFITTKYDLNLILRFSFTMILGILTALFVEDHIAEKPELSGMKLVQDHVKLSLELLKKEKKLIFIFLSVFSTGVFFFSIETYWQPRFVSLMPDESYLWILGVLSFCYFTAALIGTLVSKKIIKTKKNSINILYPFGRILLALALALLAIQSKLSGFILMFVAVYLFLGISNVPESVLINELIPSRYRASILSLNSFILQCGALGASFFCARFLVKSPISSLWFAAAGVLVVAGIPFAGYVLFRKKNTVMEEKIPETVPVAINADVE